MSERKINLYVDIVSPFGYLAFYLLRTSPTFKDVTLSYTPIVLGGLHKQCGIQAPIFIKNKSTWLNKERERWAEIFKVPMREKMPPGFPVNTVNAMRAVVAVQSEVEKRGAGGDGDVVGRCLEVLWSALWCPDAECLRGVQGKGKGENGEWDLKDPEALKTLLGSVVGEDVAGRVVGKIGSQEVKDRLMGNTKMAFEKGAFGLPWFECVNGKGEEEGFWGFDHMGVVVRFLGLDGGMERERSGQALRALL